MSKLWNFRAGWPIAAVLSAGMWTHGYAESGGRLYVQEDEPRETRRNDENHATSERDQAGRDESTSDQERRTDDEQQRGRDSDNRRNRDENEQASARNRNRSDERRNDRLGSQPVQLGIYVQETDEGIEIVDLDRNSPAARAGLQSGDILESVDGRVIDEPRQVAQFVREMRAGDRVNLVVWRDGERVRTAAVLAAGQAGERIRGPRPQRDAMATQTTHGWLGVALNDKPTDEEGDEQAGAEITLVYPTSPAAVAGLRDGDRIVAADEKKFASAESFTQYIKNKRPGEEVELSVASEDEDEPQKVKVTLASRTDYFDEGEGDENESDGGNPLYALPEYMMRMEHERRMAECQKRMEDLLLQTLREVRELKAEVAELKSARGEATKAE